MAMDHLIAMRKKAWIFLTGVLFLSALTIGQPSQPVLTVRVLNPAMALAAGKTAEVTLELRIAPGLHINSDQPLEENIIPTKVVFKPAAGLKFGQAVFPLPEMKAFSFSSEPLAVFQGRVKIQIPVTVAKEFKGKQAVIEGAVSYQACDDNSCFAPEEAVFKTVLPVAAGTAAEAPQEKTPAGGKETAGEEVKPLAGRQGEAGRIGDVAPERKESPFGTTTTEESAAQGAESGRRPEASSAEAPLKKSGGQNDLARTVQERGLPLTFVLIFLGGLALNLTPCVYPLIPITVSYFGGQAGGKKGGLVAHALLYVLGMAVTYSVLGSLAAFTGGLFGAALQVPAVLLVIAAIMVALALSMFDLYEFRLPGFLNRMAGASRKGFWGTFFMGLTVGVVAAPCIGPFVLGLLTYVGDRGNVLLGFWMFFVLALGLGVPFLALAFFSGSVNRLPRSGAWMVWVRKIFGFILLAMALYFLQPLFRDPLLYGLAMAFLLFAAGVYLAWVEPTRSAGKVFPFVRNLVGFAFLIVALLFARGGIRESMDRRLAEIASLQGGASSLNAVRWLPYNEARVSAAVKEGRPVFIDFYADWCLPCHELDQKTFSDPQVAALSKRFLMLKADLTSSADPKARALRKQYGIPGVPALVFLGEDGREKPDLRVAGFIRPKEFLGRMNRALAERP